MLKYQVFHACFEQHLSFYDSFSSHAFRMSLKTGTLTLVGLVTLDYLKLWYAVLKLLLGQLFLQMNMRKVWMPRDYAVKKHWVSQYDYISVQYVYI